jgi:hypothetical protein
MRRLYFACVTTAPPALDSPNTLTVDERVFFDIVDYAAEPVRARRAPRTMRSCISSTAIPTA